MSLSIAAIDRLFERLELSYGGEWVRKWEKSPTEDVKSMWAHELSHYANNLQAIAWSLDNLPERCPNLIEFRNLCRSAPAPEMPRLPEPKADPARVAAELSRLGEIKKNALLPSASVGDCREWARRIMGRFEAGEKLNACTLRFAREALKIN